MSGGQAVFNEGAESLSYPWFGVRHFPMNAHDAFRLDKVIAFRAGAGPDDVGVQLFFEGTTDPIELRMSFADHDRFIKAIRGSRSSQSKLKRLKQSRSAGQEVLAQERP